MRNARNARHVQEDIRRLVVRMVTDNPQWGYTRIQGALKNLGHRVARSTIARILKTEGLPPRGQRSIAWILSTHCGNRTHWARCSQLARLCSGRVYEYDYIELRLLDT